ncbi:serine acetyltransferase [Vibrio alginolyticus]|uniref:serine O-acetyltransferase n=1 Tax=Vibrio alginolyticus TaxID=663 RepID=UPI001BD3C6AE|nr:serine acetyltransferase [Vibrio alginolyticus]MBS9950499.1 serine acetyltransferase [Vibrio alginolyticus]
MLEIKNNIASDYYRYTGSKKISFFSLIKLYIIESGFAFMFWHRLSESNFFLLSFFAKINAFRLRKNYNLHISIKCKIGKGFYIGHGCNVFIAPTAVIGDNVSIHQCVTIGSNLGKAATIGNNVYISPHVCITNDVFIGNNTVIGSGSVVTRDLQANAFCVGAPAKKIKDNHTLFRSVINPFFENENE